MGAHNPQGFPTPSASRRIRMRALRWAIINRYRAKATRRFFAALFHWKHPGLLIPLFLAVVLAMAELGQNAHSATLVHLGFGLAYLFLLLALTWGLGSWLTSDFLQDKNPVEHPWDNLPAKPYQHWKLGTAGTIVLVSAGFVVVTALFHKDKLSSMQLRTTQSKAIISATEPASVSDTTRTNSAKQPEPSQGPTQPNVTRTEVPSGNNSTSPTLSGTEPVTDIVRKPIVAVIFKVSPLFTKARKERISKAIDDYYLYLIGVGFNVPKELPPIGLMPGDIITGGGVAGAPVYTGSIYIPEKSVDDLNVARLVFSNYVFARLIHPDPTIQNVPNAEYLGEVVYLYVCYYRSSFANRNLCPWQDSAAHEWVNGLWALRIKFGKEYTDNLLFDTFRMWSLFPPLPTMPFDQFFESKLRSGYTVRGDPARDDFATIRDILRKNGVTVSQQPGSTSPPKNPIHWSQKSVPSNNRDWKFQTILTIQTDEDIENPTFKIMCDAPCSFGAFDTGMNAVYGTNRAINDTTIEAGIRQSFTPRTPLSVILYANDAFHAVNVERIY